MSFAFTNDILVYEVNIMAIVEPPFEGNEMLPKDTFSKDVVLITGGGTGLGKAIALAFARTGASVAIASRKKEHLDSGIEALQKISTRCVAVECDIREPEQIENAFNLIEKSLGPVSILVNNAAANFPVPAENMSPNAWKTVTDIVLNGTFYCCREYAERRIRNKIGGSILNIGATYSWTGGPGTCHSAAAKAGVTNLTKSLAVEWAPDNIRVNCLVPGMFLHDDHPAAMKDAFGNAGDREKDAASRIPAGRTGRLHELGWAAIYLCSPFAAYISGHSLVIDGANWLRRGLVMPQFEPVRESIPSRANK